MTDTSDHIQKAIAVFDKSAARTTPNAQTAAWEVLRAELTRLAELERENREGWLQASHWRQQARVPEGYVLIAERALREIAGDQVVDQIKAACVYPVKA